MRCRALGNPHKRLKLIVKEGCRERAIAFFENFIELQHVASLRKVSNIAAWIPRSTLNSAVWEEEIKLRLGIDDATRWNSWYRLLDNIRRYQARVRQFSLTMPESFHAETM